MRTKMSKRSSDWHITGWKAIVLLPIAIPAALVAALLEAFGIVKHRDRSPEEVAGFIRDFIQGSGGGWDWDDFTSVTIRSPELESIRADACMVELPLTPAGVGELKGLLAKADVPEKSHYRQVQSGRRSFSKPRFAGVRRHTVAARSSDSLPATSIQLPRPLRRASETEDS
jgi:hypothetical protein